MRISTCIHEVEKIELKPIHVVQNTTTLARDITITLKNGMVLDYTLFSERREDLLI